MSARYLALEELLGRVDEPYQSAFRRLLAEHRDAFGVARGSSHNHQAWAGGYLDHVREAMNLAVVLHETLAPLRPLPFSLSDALVVLFVHDLEKPWAYEEGAAGYRRRPGFSAKDDAHAFRLAKLAQVGIVLPTALERAVRFVEGEGDQYTNQARGMSPLAAFCHLCDVASARLWHDHPLARDDPWAGARRS
jgi:hypothetical protein